MRLRGRRRRRSRPARPHRLQRPPHRLQRPPLRLQRPPHRRSCSQNPQAPPTPPADHALHGRALALVFFGLLLAMFISSLSETIASTALPTIVGDLNGVEIMQWVSTAYILSSTLAMPIYGKLGDLIGRKRLLMAALTLYAAGKVVCGLAMNMEMLISGRLISGLGGGGLITGIALTMKTLKPSVKIYGVMPAGSAVYVESRRQGQLVTLDHCSSMADAVVRKTGEEYLYPYIEKYVDDIFTVTEDSIRQAVRTACLYGKLTLEGSGALALAALLEKKCPLSPGTVLICSGGNIDKAVLDLCMQA